MSVGRTLTDTASSASGSRTTTDASLRPRVVVVDFNVRRTSPIGGTIRQFLEGLHTKYEFVVVAGHFENPSADDIEHVHVRLPPGPTFVTELCWPSLVRLAFRRRRLDRRRPFVTVATQGQMPGAEIATAHFCHRAYLKEYYATSGTRGLRRISRNLVHRYHARLEALAFRRARVVTVPSRGLWNEIAHYYPFVTEKLVHVPYPIELVHFVRDASFDRASARAGHGYSEDDVVFAFVGLGDFARKGLEVAIQGLAQLESDVAKILVVGGTKGEIGLYRDIATAAGVERRVLFVGFQTDIRPYLWASDVFLFPTVYETFSKASYEAAAAGLPVIATRVHGIEDLINDGVNGWFVDRIPESIAEAMQAAVTAGASLSDMGQSAREAVRPYDVGFYVDRCDAILASVASEIVADGSYPDGLAGPSSSLRSDAARS